MKTAGIVLRNFKNGLSELDFSSSDAFLKAGYPFEEVRLLSRKDREAFLKAAEGLAAESENLVVIAEKSLLPSAREWLSEKFNTNFLQGTLSGAGLFEKENCSLFLVSPDSGESGAEYVRNVCVPFLEKKYSTRFDRIVLRAVGAEKERIKELLREALRMSGDKLTYNDKERYGESVVEILYDSSAPKMLADGVLRLFAEGLGDAVYALDDTPLEKRLVQLLKLRGKKISVAESFTGGGVGRRIVSVPGASEVYFEGLNTYDERAKIKRLGVSEYTLRTVGAVSDETAYEMAAGLIASGDCDISVATTGLAGPKSDRTELPVGLAYIAVGLKEKVYVYRYRFEGTREEITETAINYALFLAYRQLKNL